MPSGRLGTITAVLQLCREALQISFQVLLKHLDGLMVHAGGSFVRLHSRKGLQQIRAAVNLINQTEPFASFNSLFESCQHPFRPDRRFGPRPAGTHFSSLCSHHWHYRWFCFRRSVHHVSTFLRSLRSTPITELPRYYGRSDSCLPLGSLAPLNASMNTLLPGSQVSLIHAHGLPDHSVSNHLAPAGDALSRYPSARQLTVLPVRLRHCYAGSSGIPGRIEFVILRLVVHLLLPPTPPLGDAVAFSFRPENVCLERTYTSLTTRALRRT